MAQRFVKLQWNNTTDLGGVYYQGGFTNKMFLDTEFTKPDYETIEEGFENQDGVFVITSQTLKKRYRFDVVVPEYVVDALKFMTLHDTIFIAYTDGTFNAFARNVQIDVSWQTEFNDCFAHVTVSFEIDDQVVKTPCGSNL